MHTNISNSKLENTEIPQNHNHNYNTDDVTIIIQGVISDNVHVIQLIDEYKNYGKIIISSYFQNHSDLKKQIEQQYPNIKVVENNNVEEFKNNWNNQIYQRFNIWCQVSTVRNALAVITDTKYVIKTRIDSYFSNMNTFIYEVIKNHSK